MGERVKGSNPHGLDNEKLIVQALDGRKIKDLNSNLKKFIKNICEENLISATDDMIISSKVETNNKLKQDFYITIKERKFGISTKMGNGNSVHQEKIEEFIKWISENSVTEITNEIKDCLRFFIWADGSVNGKAKIEKGNDGKIIGRFGVKDFKKLYPEKRDKLQEFFEKNTEIIINRAIFEGKYKSKVDYVYHGTPFNGVWISKKDILQFNIQNPKSKDLKNKSPLTVGKLSIQAWNVSLDGNNEKKRGEIQFKYGSMVDDFEKLMFLKATNIGTYEGDKEEFNISQVMNKNKKHKFWDVISNKCNLDDDKDHYYIIKVDGNKKSELTGKKVKCKTDNFIIKANLSRDYLLKNQYELTEKALEDIERYAVIENSGISVKRADSKSYTIIKLTQNTFMTAFEPYIDGGVEFITAGLLLYSDENKIHINQKILEDLKIKEETFISFYSKRFDINGTSVQEINFVSEVGKKTREYVKEIIEKNSTLKASLFTGIGWFDNPYYVNFIFKSGELTSEVYTDYTISNGSGRSKGKYTIVLKPQ